MWDGQLRLSVERSPTHRLQLKSFFKFTDVEVVPQIEQDRIQRRLRLTRAVDDPHSRM
jgi:hypothetical protein